MKVVINRGIGGFGLSQAAIERLGELACPLVKEYLEDHSPFFDTEINNYDPYDTDYCRSDALLVKVVEELGQEANGSYAELKIVEIPDGVDYRISVSESGIETIHEVHRVWY